VVAATATVGEAFVALTRAALEQIEANAAGAASGKDPEYLHQLRVGVRRLRSALRAFRGLLRRRRADAIERLWCAMMRILGAARDWDVFRQSHRHDALDAPAAAHRAQAQQRVRELLRSPRFDRTLRSTFAWAQWLPLRRKADPGERVGRFAARALDRLHGKLRDEASGIDWRDAARRHRVRIRLKRVRYGCDFFAAAFRQRKAQDYLEALRLLQDVLGEMNDIEVQRGLLRRLAPRGSALAVVEVEAAMRAKLAARERELIATLAPAWSAFEARPQYWRRPEAAGGKG